MIDLQELAKLQTADGQKEFLDLVSECRKEAGANWLDELKREFPQMFKIADLVVNHTFAEAYEKVLIDFPAAWMVRPALEEAHKKLKFEIERKRF